ncbi:MAG: UDP-N-acetylmuramoyl-tripeptide--D-alanyl-D-alanine ligase [Chloroflexi bacterium]|nr:UDP-N-acetylmuramoyl-tripeptide--D-alanyl-D-alanine ligase [Chloroflexota bacterium]
MLAVRDVAEGLGPTLVALVGSPENGGFPRVIIDSRQAGPGDLFVALRGEREDGHAFVADAVNRGAAGAIVARPLNDLPEHVASFHVSDPLSALQRLAAYWRARHQVRVVGVTGSVGKTTCKEVIAAVLGKRFAVLKSEANLNTEIGLPLTLLGLRPDHQAAVLEMAMFGPGEIALLCRIARPDVGVVTNIAPVHMERLGSPAAIVSAKAELVEALPSDGVAVLNGDDREAARLAERAKGWVLLFGASEQCRVRGSEVTGRGLEGISFRLTYGEASVPVSTPLPGRHNLYSALAAAAVALSEGMTLPEIAEALAEARCELRLRTLPGPNGSTIIDDTYNASPPSMKAALDLLSEMPGRRLALLGDMRELGAADEEGHRQVGRLAAATADGLVLIGEGAALMAEEAKAAGLRDVRLLFDKEEAADVLRTELKRGDYLLVKASRALALETVVEALNR